ncbi:hypothetical protein KKJ30_21040, partial [Xenorhabdus bovienii]|nr:hypothetical protein [Xenorhabdus bovienii]
VNHTKKSLHGFRKRLGLRTGRTGYFPKGNKYAAFQAFCIPTEETAIDADAEAHQVAPKSADAVLRDFTEYATNEVNKEKLQQEYVNTWTALNGHPELQERCKEVTGIRIKELKREAA